jgi:hypothetical protein
MSRMLCATAKQQHTFLISLAQDSGQFRMQIKMAVEVAS